MMEFVVSVILYRLWAAAVAAMHRPYWEPVLKAFAAAGADYNRVNRRGDSALDLRLDLLSSDLQLVERSLTRFHPPLDILAGCSFVQSGGRHLNAINALGRLGSLPIRFTSLETSELLLNASDLYTASKARYEASELARAEARMNQ
jgi:hypothetical protein